MPVLTSEPGPEIFPAAVKLASVLSVPLVFSSMSRAVLITAVFSSVPLPKVSALAVAPRLLSLDTDRVPALMFHAVTSVVEPLSVQVLLPVFT
ncbi:Uncharacterised protein [Yersinia kristensenii]|uniref:Uncharacterized protein n=1 Tax=Yersinia kristensenii TaxID=28152 RepID=A0A0T9KMD6_YERKR|nr:Uncharacterised protein [Yersinia kristensenii]